MRKAQPPEATASTVLPPRPTARSLRFGVFACAAMASAWPLCAVGQPATKVRRVGWLVPDVPNPGEAYQQFVRRAAELGHVEGQNLLIDYRSFRSIDEGEQMARALVRLQVVLIVAQAPSALLVARKATSTVPIVTFFVGDPVRMGVVKSLAQPGGNVTGFTWDTGAEGSGKLLEVLKELLPESRRVGLLWNRGNASHPHYVEWFETHAAALGLAIVAVSVSQVDEFAGAFRQLKAAGAGSVIVFTDPFTVQHREAMSAALALHPMPALWQSAAWPWSDAVVTYGPDVSDQPRRAAEYLGRIFKGEAAGTLPFQQPSRVDLIINVRVAHAHGITVPKSMFARASQVLQ